MDIDGTWRSYDSIKPFSVVRGIEITHPVKFIPKKPIVGYFVTAEYTIKNFGSRAIELPHLGVIARGPNCSGWECSGRYADFPIVENITLQPNEEYTYSQKRIFDTPGTGYFADAVFADSNHWWYLTPNNMRLFFSVISPFYQFLPLARK